MEYGYTNEYSVSITALDFLDLHVLQDLCKKLEQNSVGARDALVDRLVRANIKYGNLKKVEVEFILKQLGLSVKGNKDELTILVMERTAAAHSGSVASSGVMSGGGGGGGVVTLVSAAYPEV